jgi:steroid 5-alpha reductase family enzyme
MWVFVTLLPTLMLNETAWDVPLKAQDYIGWCLWGLGLILETVADAQKSIFRANKDNQVK